MNAANKTALVTGARRGIGRATAAALARRGLTVAVTTRGPATSLEETVSEIEGSGGKAIPFSMDLSDRGSIDTAVEALREATGTVAVLVNNALCDQPGSQEPIDAMDFAAFERMVIGEVVNTSYLTRRVLDLADPGGLTIVNVGSGAGEHVPRRPVGQGGWAFSYSATKAALHRLAPFLQLEWGGRGVRAFTVDPGFTRTEALLERLGDVPGSAPPALPAEVIAWLACDPGCDVAPGSYLSAPAVSAAQGWGF